MPTERIPDTRFIPLAIAGLLLSASSALLPAWGQTVQKCTGSDGHVTFTSSACPDGQRQAATYDATPEVMTAERAAALEHRRRQEDANSRYLEAQARGGTMHPPGHRQSRPAVDSRAGCDSAKAHRDATLRRVGLRRTHDLLRKLDDRVYEACK